MNKFLLTLLLCIPAASVNAQMDERFYFPTKGLDMPESQRFDTMRVPVGGGDTLFNAFFKAKGKAKAGVFLVHGAGGNIAKYLFMMEPMVKAGYNVYMVDFRGYGRSTGKPTHQNIAADAPLAFENFRKHAAQQGLPVFIYGASMGSQIAAKLTQDNASGIKALIIDGGFTAINDLAAMHVPDSLRESVRMSIKPPYPASESLRALRTVPKIFVHSREDKDVPFALGEALYQAASEPKELMTYSGPHLMLMKSDPSAIIFKMDQIMLQR